MKVFMIEDTNLQGDVYQADQYYTLDRAQSNQLINEGKALESDNTDLDRFDRDITAAVNKFRPKYKALETSKDPRYKDENFFNYEATKLREEMETEVKRLQAEYAEIVKNIKDEASRERANLTRTISQTDKDGADQLLTELVTVAKLNGIERAIERLENDLPYYMDGRKQALADELPRLIDLVKTDDRATKRRLRALNNRLREDSEGVELAYRMANALPDHVGGAYTRIKHTHTIYSK